MTTTSASRPPTGHSTARERLRVRLTLVDPLRPGAAADVVVEAPTGTVFAEVRPALAEHGVAAERPVSCLGAAVPGSAVVGRPPLLDGAVLVAAQAPPRTPLPLLEVRAVSGPDAGRRTPLAPGSWLLGRGPDAVVRVDDPDVSRAHALVTVAASGVTVTDLGSSNGSALAPPGLAGTPLDAQAAQPWPDGEHLVVGSTRLALAVPREPGVAADPDGAGHLLVNRAPRVRAASEPAVVTFPDPPAQRRPTRLPWPALVLPLLVAVPSAFLWHQPSFLLLALVTPLALLGQHLVERRSGGREARQAAAAHAGARAEAEALLAAAVAADAVRAEESFPDLAALTAVASGPGRRLWERTAGDGDAFVVRVGTGPAPPDVTVEGPDAEPPRHECAPVTVDLAAGVVGLAGEGARALARAVVGQVACLLSPHDLRLVVRAAGHDEDWSWAVWLPHTEDALPAADEDGPDRLDDVRATGAGGPVRLVVLAGAGTLRRDPAVAALLDAAARPARGRRTVLVLCVEDDASRLPVECRATVVVGRGDGPGAVADVRDGRPPRRCVPDGLGAATAARLARDLARLRDATPDPGRGALPDRVGLLPLLGLGEDPPGADSWPSVLARRWQRAAGPATLRVPLGAAAGGPWSVDLRADGPHVLVAGTTGAGKSELLRSLVAGLAATHRPDEVSFLLVDYKGGTAFAGLEALPHVGGLLTDLDRHTARRTLTSLRAELRRRERLLLASGAGDLDAYDRLPDRAAGDPLPRLVLVVDEFRVLAEELPGLLDGLVRVAAVGRSLGVHLVLATQRPAGVVSADMRANLNLRIALRVRDRADSDDVVDSPAAASIAADLPGRAVVRAGGRPLLSVQTALLAGERTDAEVSVRPLRPAPGTGRPGTSPAPDLDVPRLVAACTEAARRAGVPAVRPPWLPPLPTGILLDTLLDTLLDSVPANGSGLVLGMCDVPDEQRREPLVWNPDAGGLAVVGGPSSGRTTTLRAVVAAALRSPDEAHVHVVTTTGGLGADLGTDRPPVSRLGTVVPVTDVERLGRLVRRLADDPSPAHRTILVVDGWEAVVEALAAHDRGRGLDTLLGLLRDGTVRLAASGGRSLLTGPAGAVVGTRLLLRTADPADVLVAGLDPGDVPEVMTPGRAVLLSPAPDGSRRTLEAQVALLAPDPHPAAQDRALASLCRAAVATAPGPLRLVRLPDVVAWEQLAAGPGVPPGEAVVGVGGDDGRPVSLPLPPGEVVLVAGPSGSGRTTALATVQAAARAGRQVRTVQDLREGPLPPGGGEQTADLVLVVDDVEQQPPDVLDAVERLVAAGATAVVAATGAEAVVAFRGPLAQVRRSRTGVLLGAVGPGEGEVLGVRDGGPAHGPPGRGLLVVRGRSTTVQVARPPRAASCPVDETSRRDDATLS